MADQGEAGRRVFDVEAASALVSSLRDSFGSGRTRSYEWRVSQLRGLVKLCDDHEKEIADALYSDLAKPELESVVYEVRIS